jgi:hypothetical protein
MFGRESPELTGRAFARILGKRKAHYPVSDAYERDYLSGPSRWTSQQEHVTSWLEELDGPGAHNRSTRGTGKSHLLIALGTAAAEKGFRVKYTLATRLVNELVEAADEKNLARTIARYGRVDLLMIDELGYMELDRRGAELLFQVLTEREENNSIAIASNESFSGWTKTLTDPRLCAAIVDRLTFNGTIIETGTDSYRLAHSRHHHAQP